MNVSWVKLTLEEARGFVTGYTVTYDSLESRRRRTVRIELVGAEESYKVVSGLEFTKSYSITVSARTLAGEGVASSPVIAQGEWINVHIAYCYEHMSSSQIAPPYLAFQLRMTGIDDCYQWRVSDTIASQTLRKEQCFFFSS